MAFKRCYEREDWLKQFGYFDYYHCGNGFTASDGLRYCLDNGVVDGYACVTCACIYPPDNQLYLSGFEEVTE